MRRFEAERRLMLRRRDAWERRTAELNAQSGFILIPRRRRFRGGGSLGMYRKLRPFGCRGSRSSGPGCPICNTDKHFKRPTMQERRCDAATS